MKKYLCSVLFLWLAVVQASAQVPRVRTNDYNSMDPNGNVATANDRRNRADSTSSHKEIPKGIYVWTVDSRFGDRKAAQLDTLSHMYMNTIFTSGLRGEYNTTGNLGSPRQARVFVDRQVGSQFLFTDPYDYFITPVSDFHFTNTLSPFTNLTYNNCGDRTNGEDHFTAKFGVNAGKRLGVGFKFDYLYGRGYYDSQSTSHFDYTMYGSYLGDRYQAHLLMSTNHQKVTENGGITNDNYITHPESFNESFNTSEIPTMLARNWNRNDNQHIFFTQRYSVGFKHKVPMTAEEIAARKFAMASQLEAKQRRAKAEAARKARQEGEDVDEDDVKAPATFAGRPDNAKIGVRAKRDSLANDSLEGGLQAPSRLAVNGKAAADSLLAKTQEAKVDTSWLKDEYVPVTSFIHTLDFNNYRRIYEAYQTPADYYLHRYNVAEKLTGDSIYDKTTHWSLRNTFAISMLEGFNKWAKAGLKLFGTHELRHFTLPDSLAMRSWNENALSVGAQLIKAQGRTLHYNVTGELGVAGVNAGEIHVDGGIDVNFPLWKDTMTLAASGFYHHEKPSFYYRHYQGRHFWWDDDDLSMVDHFRVQGVLRYQKTRTTLRVAFDEMKNYTYFATTYTTSDAGRLANAVEVRQAGDPISVFTAELKQDFTLGPLNWETVATVQKSTNEDALPLPLVNVYTNLYLRFKIAHVLKCDFGADVRYFTKYKAPDYVPAIGQYAVQANDVKTEIGNYPLVNVYANFHLKHTRFFAMMSHVNASSGGYFFAPHYPLNGRVFRFGVSWNFFN
ncbi:putative porin [Hallella sp.]|uniref:putative porin n=1 Tax=Hallella sp. TaxID=2980186 RepID=UPI002A9206DE|nr:putative porin [Hallella sp.]MDY5924681.1 putative porin [Hallella sp.]